ncbi:unnamed protein product [Tuber aestivum]|uniref:Beta-hexosaminidase n=1 Tax=Tuber aestivum TaxID=59557 RepID=A0A292PYG4_9PEZI|nr:unnamed protein product [Tuber aestivum]
MISKFSIAIALLALTTSANALWPIPQSYKHGDTTVWLSPDVQLVFDSPLETHIATKNKVREAWSRTRGIIFQERFVPWKFYPRGTKFEPENGIGTVIKKVFVEQTSVDKPEPVRYGEFDESYTLTVPVTGGNFTSLGPYGVEATLGEGGEPGAVYITAGSSLGVLHAFTTLTQLFYYSNSHRGGVYSKLAPVEINDKPKFQHRGLNLDVARQWYPKEDILKTIDALSWNKMNRLHLHVTDSQSWPLEIPALPDLAAKGAYADGLTYSPQDLQDILTWGRSRGVEVILEIDMPGHTTSIAEAYPELITGRDKQPDWVRYAAQPPSGSLKLRNPAVKKFLTTLFDDLLPRLRSHSQYFHTGGDEVNKNVYNLDENIKSNDPAVLQPALQDFVSHAHTELGRHGVTPLVWEEMLLDWNLTLPKDAIVQTWMSGESLKKVIEKGHRVIAGDYSFWYLDCGRGQWLDFLPASYKYFHPFNDYCSPSKNWRLVYSYDPAAGLTQEQAKQVLGGEVHAWSEQIDPVNIDSVVWPRASAAAEVLWSGRTDAAGNNRTFPDASPRLAEFRERLVLRGVGASPIQQLWCHQHPGGCQL